MLFELALLLAAPAAAGAAGLVLPSSCRLVPADDRGASLEGTCYTDNVPAGHRVLPDGVKGCVGAIEGNKPPLPLLPGHTCDVGARSPPGSFYRAGPSSVCSTASFPS